MKYSDVVQFEPITTVIQIREADRKERARELVKTFVISEGMKERIVRVLIPNLSFEEVRDSKGMLIVGNYGTGKSHFMSVISSLAEDADMSEYLTNKEVAAASPAIGGKFKVIRAEIGGVKMSLRDIVLSVIEDNLATLGILFHFPPADKVTNNKDSLVQMMGVFNERFPDSGYLLVIDELLDYLLSRKDQEFVYDLNFLRELGEICRSTRFRFMAGIQESLFDNPRFSFVANTLLKVKDRYEQLRIVREDVEFVVGQRLLKKDAKQKALIREHLEGYARLYPTIGTKIGKFVELFPIHPKYIEVFEKITIAEKREILRTLSEEMEAIRNDQVPEDSPGLITYDSYWGRLTENPSIRSVEGVREVIDKSSVLEDRVEHAFPKAVYKDTALKLIHGLSVNRLTTDNTHTKVGPTAEELRDDLCPSVPNLPEKDAGFLKTTLETILRDTMATVNYQFITLNKENGQYYLDLEKDVDYDGLIEKKAETLDKNVLDRYYFDVLKRVMECAVSTYVTGFNIWEHQVEWKERQTTRQGYLFFGVPTERSTAQPPRDFYIYFVQRFDPPQFTDEKRSDEVFFRLGEIDEKFLVALKTYAASKELAATSTGMYKTRYEEKSEAYIKTLASWLREQLVQAFQVTYLGTEKKALEWSRGRPGETVRDIVNGIAARCLDAHFRETYPSYPTFSHLVTLENRQNNALEAINFICGKPSLTGREFCDDLGLLDNDVISPQRSPYALPILNLLKGRGIGQVVNRNEILMGEAGVELERETKLEPEWVVVVLSALVYSGFVTISLPGRKIDASNLKELASIPLEQLTSFKHIERPKEMPVGTLVALSRVLGIVEGQVRNESTRDVWVHDLQAKVSDLSKRVASLRGGMGDKFIFGGEHVLSETRTEDYESKLHRLGEFLDGLAFYDTPAKLKSFRYDLKEVEEQGRALKLLLSLEQLSTFLNEISRPATYLQTGLSILSSNTEIADQISAGISEIATKLRDEKAWGDDELRRQFESTLNGLKAKYIKYYVLLHKDSRLGLKEDKAKSKLLTDARLQQLSRLENITFMNRSQLVEFRNKLAEPKTCFSLVERDLENEPMCPYCKLIPSQTRKYAPSIIEDLDKELDSLYDGWKKVLLDNLSDPAVKKNIELLPSKQSKLVKDFINSKELPPEVDNNFVQAVQDTLQGLVKVVVSFDELKRALLEGGTPCTPEEFSRRFTKLVEDKTYGKDKKRSRIILE